MRKISQWVGVAVLGLGVAVVGCNPSTPTRKDKMGAEKMDGDKMKDDKMKDGKMKDDKMKDDKMKDDKK